MIQITINQKNIPVELIYKRSNRRIYLRVKAGVVYITTPVKLSLSKIEELIAKNFNFIMKHMKETEKIDNQIHFLGKLYALTFLYDKSNMIEVKDTEIVLTIKSLLDAEKLIQELYKRALIKVVEEYAEEIISLFEMPKDIEFIFKRVKGYYGECFPKKKKIILSTRLAKYELKYILSVIYHECAHFKYPHHQKEYYEYLEQRYPNYKRIQKELRKITYHEQY
ncbi:MAG: M48 family metallopeptidase [Acholeplasmatales bacterium]|nr:M48 family metallopeptidase [Acholeplasmatales bacterium]